MALSESYASSITAAFLGLALTSCIPEITREPKIHVSIVTSSNGLSAVSLRIISEETEPLAIKNITVNNSYQIARTFYIFDRGRKEVESFRELFSSIQNIEGVKDTLLASEKPNRWRYVIAFPIYAIPPHARDELAKTLDSAGHNFSSFLRAKDTLRYGEILGIAVTEFHDLTSEEGLSGKSILSVEIKTDRGTTTTKFLPN